MRGLICLLFGLFFCSAQAETWTYRGAALAPTCTTQAWECTGGAPSGAIYEPKVQPKNTGCLIVASPCLGMWYSGGWGTCSVGYAETADLSGASGWQKYSGNPIIGQGALGFSIACRKSVFVDSSGVYWITFSNGIGAGSDALYLTNSTNGVTGLSAPVKIIAPGANDLALANTFVWQDGSLYRLLYDAKAANGKYAYWQTFAAVSTSISGPWNKLNNGASLAGFQVTGGSTSYAAVKLLNGIRNYWFHQSPPGAGALPSDIYHGCDPLLPVGTITLANSAAPIIAHRTGFDQAADPWPIDLQGIGSIFADEDNNVTPYAQISLWTSAGPLQNISCP